MRRMGIGGLVCLAVACASNEPPPPRVPIPLPSDAIDEASRPVPPVALPEPTAPVALASVDLSRVPVVLPPSDGPTLAPHTCGGRYASASRIAEPLRVLDSAGGIGVDRHGARLLRFTPTQIDVFDGDAWQRVADQRTRPPGAEAPFTQLHGGWIEDGVVVFRGSFDDRFGLFRWERGELIALADRTTTAPGSSAPFTELGYPVLSGGTVWFWAEQGGSRDEATLYTWHDGRLGAPALAVRAGAPIARDGTILFSGYRGPPSSSRGIYAFEDDRLDLLVPPTATAPDGSPLGPLVLGEPSPFRGGLLFVADADRDATRRGLWFAESQRIHTVIDPDTTRVDERGGFSMVAAVGPFSDADVIVFQSHRFHARGEATYGLYALRGCTVFSLVEVGERLDDRTVTSVAHMYPQAVEGGWVFFPVVFADGDQATYAARLR